MEAEKILKRELNYQRFYLFDDETISKTEQRVPKGEHGGGQFTSSGHGVSRPDLKGNDQQLHAWGKKLNAIDNAHHNVMNGGDLEAEFAAVQPNKTAHKAVHAYHAAVKAATAGPPPKPEPTASKITPKPEPVISYPVLSSPKHEEDPSGRPQTPAGFDSPEWRIKTEAVGRILDKVQNGTWTPEQGKHQVSLYHSDFDKPNAPESATGFYEKATSWLKSGGKTKSGLKDHEAALQYQAGTHQGFISSLRNGEELSPEKKDLVNKLDELTAKPFGKNATLYRGVSGEFASMLDKSKSFSDKSFVSFSSDKKVAMEFAGSGALIRMRYTKEMPAMDMNSVMKYNMEEAEIVLPRNKKFIIKKRSTMETMIDGKTKTIPVYDVDFIS